MRAIQKRFFDYFLKGDGEYLDWPRVQISSRVGLFEETGLRGESDFPLPSTEYTTYHLAGATSTLSRSPAEMAQVSYDSTKRGDHVHFDLRFDENTEVTGYAKLHVWVKIIEGKEADLFVMVQKLDTSSKAVALGPSLLSIIAPSLPVTATELLVCRGWLRASYRQRADDATDLQPKHSDKYRDPLIPGQSTAVDVELWPTSATFRAGEGIRLIVSGKDIINEAKPLAHDNANTGRHTLLTGGEYDSTLTLPIIPMIKVNHLLSFHKQYEIVSITHNGVASEITVM